MLLLMAREPEQDMAIDNSSTDSASSTTSVSRKPLVCKCGASIELNPQQLSAKCRICFRYTCLADGCNTSLPSYGPYNDHMELHHKDICNSRCRHCGQLKTLTGKSLMIQCPACDVFWCDHCSYEDLRALVVRAHIGKEHKHVFEEIATHSKASTPILVREETLAIPSQVCSDTETLTASDINFLADSNQRQPLQCQCGATIKLRPRQCFARCEKCKRFKCLVNDCNNVYVEYTKYNDHMKKHHHQINRNKCMHCGQPKTLTGKFQMSRCPVCKVCWCNVCPFEGEQERGMRIHIGRHPVIKTY